MKIMISFDRKANNGTITYEITIYTFSVLVNPDRLYNVHISTPKAASNLVMLTTLTLTYGFN